MKNRDIIGRIVVLGLFCLAAWTALSAQQNAFRVTLQPVMEMQYLLYLPEAYENEPETEFPLLLFLHGGGESGDNIERVKTHGPPSMIEKGKDFPFLVLTPQNPHPRKLWNETALMALLDQIEKDYRVDRTRIWVAGLSRGAYGAWRLAIQYPERFAVKHPITMQVGWATCPSGCFMGRRTGPSPSKSPMRWWPP